MATSTVCAIKTVRTSEISVWKGESGIRKRKIN